jgi:uncharacterized protein (DUF302 family)
MSIRIVSTAAAALMAIGAIGCETRTQSTLAANPTASQYGIVATKSALAFGETLDRLRADIAAKKLMFFQSIDQQKLAADSGIATRPSTLLVFGNPALGTQFITANPQAGIDWPVRMLVYQDGAGQVWVEYTDFSYIAHRHAIDDRDPQFKMASEVAASVAASVRQ